MNIHFGQINTESIKITGEGRKKTIEATGSVGGFGEYSVTAKKGLLGTFKAVFTNGEREQKININPTGWIEREIFGAGETKRSGYDSRVLENNHLASDASTLFDAFVKSGE